MPETDQVEEPGRGGMYRTLLQSAGLFLVVQWGMKQFFPPAPKAVTLETGNTTVLVPATIPAFEDRAVSAEQFQGPYNAIPQRIAPIWAPDISLDISIFVSPSITPPSLAHPDPAISVLEEKDFKYGVFSEGREAHTSFAVPPIVQNNGTLWAHFFVAKAGSTLDPAQPSYDSSTAYRFTRPLTQYLKQHKEVKKRNLLDSTADIPEDPEDTTPKYTSHYHPNLTLSFIPDAGILDWTAMNPGIREWIILESSAARDPSGQNGWYYPVLFLNTFWQLRSHMTEINSTVSTLDLNLHLNELSSWKFSILASMDYGFKEQREKAARGEKMAGGGDGSEIEMLKQILLDSNVYLLGTTVIVGILHTVFEMLAFKNDVSHWRNKKDNVGISVRTILANVFMQTVIFLYLLDNNENTSWMILMGQGVGILIEFWKITKTVDVRVRPTGPETTGVWRYLPYEVKFEDKHKLSETEKQTQEYDQIAFGYMAYLAVPLLAAYAVYSLYYESHKSWYSFVITTLVGSVYAYGFLLLLPSLYINYRLQSVAHMPGKAMTYKVLSTFIDDLFAFTIKMPTLHRLATLRDDVVFFVYLYQSWKYKVDYGRVNEFGQGGDDEDEEVKAVVEGVEKVAGEVGSVDQGERKKVDGAKLIEADWKASSSGRDGESDVKRRKQ